MQTHLVYKSLTENYRITIHSPSPPSVPRHEASGYAYLLLRPSNLDTKSSQRSPRSSLFLLVELPLYEFAEHRLYVSVAPLSGQLCTPLM